MFLKPCYFANFFASKFLRGELIEVSIEAVFEPMVQGYIIFPSIIGIIHRLVVELIMGLLEDTPF